jgi:hypothetical protein
MSDGIDVLGTIFKLVPVTVSIGVLMISVMIYRLTFDKVTKESPRWFILIPFALGLTAGVPDYLLKHLEDVLTQPIWITVLETAQVGFFYGAGAVALWEVRKKIWPLEGEGTQPMFKSTDKPGGSV